MRSMAELSQRQRIALMFVLGAFVGMIGFCVLVPVKQVGTESVISFDVDCIRNHHGASVTDCEVGHTYGKALAKWAVAPAPVSRLAPRPMHPVARFGPSSMSATVNPTDATLAVLARDARGLAIDSISAAKS